MYNDFALVILSLSCSSSFLTIVMRIYRYDELLDPANKAARLLVGLAFSGIYFLTIINITLSIFLSLVYSLIFWVDFVAALTWLLENRFPICPTFMIFKYFGFTSACIFTNCIGMCIYLTQYHLFIVFIFFWGLGIELIAIIQKKSVSERFYYIASYLVPIVLSKTLFRFVFFPPHPHAFLTF